MDFHGHTRVSNRGADAQLARHVAVLHRVLGIQQKIQQHLLDLLAVDAHWRKIVPIVSVDLDVRHGEFVRAQLDRTLDDVIQARDRALCVRAPYEREQILDDLGRAIGLRKDALEIFARFLAPFVIEKQLGEPDHGLERVVELVGDARNELPSRGQALGVYQLIAKLCFTRDVALDRDELRHAPGVVGQRRQGARGQKGRTVLSGTRECAAPDAVVLRRRCDRGELRPGVLGEELRSVHLDDLVGRVPDHPAEGVVGVLHAAIRPHDRDQLVGLLGCGGQQSALPVGLPCFAVFDGQSGHQQRKY